MTEEVKTTPEAAVIAPEAEAPQTMEQINAAPEKETVGLDKFLELKKENKEFKKSIKDLQDTIAKGATKAEVSADIDSLSQEYPDVDKSFLTKLASTIKAQAEKDIEDKIESRLKPFEQKEKAEKLDAAFNKHFNLALDKMPEFKEVVNPEVIKTLSLMPKNSNKTFSEIIEETYGNALTGKRTIEKTTPGGGKESEPLDFDKARQNGEYFAQIMATPALKKEYNDLMLKRGL